MAKSTFPMREEWSDKAFNEHDNFFEGEETESLNKDASGPDKLDKPFEDEEEDRLLEDEEASSPSGNKSRTRRTRRRKIRVTEEAACQLVSRGREQGMILHALYVHRRLTITQIHSLYFQEVHIDKIRSIIRRLLSNGLVERKRVFAVAQTLADTRTYHYSLTGTGIRVYASVCMKIAWLHEDPNLPKQHYSQNDLQIGQQADHHFILQEYLAGTLGRLRKEKVYIPNCEWRRYLFMDSMDEVHYRPDWVLFAQSEFFRNLVEEGHIGEDILSVPILTRNESDLKLLTQHYQPLISVECDTGTMRHGSLYQKCIRIRNEKSHIPRCVAILASDCKLGEERVKTKWSDNKVRIRNISNTVRELLETEMVSDEIIFLIGKQTVLSDITASYLRTSSNLTADFHQTEASIMTSDPQFKPLVKRDWEKRRIKAGFPDFSFVQEERITACYYAMPGWLNPQVKANALLEQTSQEVHAVLIYLSKEMFVQDVHLFLSDRLSYIALDEWLSGKRILYTRVIDRSGEHWGVRG